MRKGSQEDKNRSKANKSQKKQEKSEKSNQLSKQVLRKTKQGFAKIKNRIEHTVTKKNLMHLIKKSASTIPHLLTKQQSKALLPKLQKIILPTISNNHSPQSVSNFEEIEGKLTQSMVMFRQNAKLQCNDLWAIQLQTQKCYKMIPSFYFKEHMNSEQLTRHLVLTKNYRDMQENMLTLGDFLDQVQFNINQQANAKIKIFMNFVICTNSIQDLVNINLSKLKATRKHTGILRDIIVSRAVRINQCRLKKQKIQETLDILNLLKKLKNYESKLQGQIAVGNYIPQDNKSKLGAMFHEYCQLHNVELNKLCCQTGKNRCKYWDIVYFVQRSFQDNFMKIVRNYLFEVIDYHREIDNFKKMLTVNKKNFMTTPNSSSISVNVDESFQVEGIQNVELFTKIYIEKQIISLFEQGVHRYSFSTEILEKELKQFLSLYINKFLKSVLGAVDNDQRVTLKDLNEVQDGSFYESEKYKQKILKLSWPIFYNLVDMVLLRFQYLSTRLMSLVQKLLEKAVQLQQQSPQRYEVFCAYMSQLVGVLTQQSDNYIAAILQNRIKDGEKSMQLFKSKEDIIKEFDLQSESMKRLVKYCKKWIGHVQSLQKTYSLTKKSFDMVLAKSHKHIQEEINRWAPKVSELKANLVKSTYQLLHKTITNRDLKQKLEQQRWQFIDIKTHIYNDLGYIIGGKNFLAVQERNHRESLSKSILMERSLTEMQRTSQLYNKQQYSSRFKINPNYITLGSHLKFKLTSSTQQMIQFLRKYLELYDDISDKRKKSDLQAKLTQMILMYNQYVKDLILKGQAVKLEKIRTKSITARHLIITYMQLQLVQYVYTGQFVQKRVGFTKDDTLVMREKIQATQLQIRKKYQKVIEMRILDTIQALNLKDEHWLESQGMQSIPKNLQASIQLFSQLMLNEGEYEKFVDMEPNWAAELLSKVSKGSKGKQYKLKCFAFLLEEIKPFARYLPKLMTAVKSVIY